MQIQVATLIGLIAALIVTIALCIMVVPERHSGKLNPVMQKLHDILNFKKLFIEMILKAIYIFSTCYCIFTGFLLLFSYETYYTYYSYGSYESIGSSTATQGLVMLLAGPVILRIVYELVMIFILAVKNLIEINRKVTPISKSFEEKMPQEPKLQYCTQCGTQFDINHGDCPNCGKI